MELISLEANSVQIRLSDAEYFAISSVLDAVVNQPDELEDHLYIHYTLDKPFLERMEKQFFEVSKRLR